MSETVKTWSAHFVGMLPRRGFLAVLGKATAAVSLMMAGTTGAAQAACDTCGGCGSIPCGSIEAGCCPDCLPLGGNWCGGSATAWNGQCVNGGCSYGWYWYCCQGSTMRICQDCCCSGFNCTTRGPASGNCPFGPAELTAKHAAMPKPAR